MLPTSRSKKDPKEATLISCLNNLKNPFRKFLKGFFCIQFTTA